MVAGPLLAQVEAVTLLRSLLIALVIVSPFGYLLWRRVRARRTPAAPGRDTPADPPEHPRLEDVIAAVPALATTVAEEGRATLEIPATVTLDGDPAPRELVDPLVRDALRRSGLAVVDEVDGPAGRLLGCAALDDAAP